MKKMMKKYKLLLSFIIGFVCLSILLVICFYIKNNVSITKEFFITSIPTDIKLSEDEKKVNDYLNKIKIEADKLYSSLKPYGIIDWNDSYYSQELLDFSRAVPKGGDLHIHNDKVISVSAFIDLLLQYEEVYIILEKGSQYGYLFAGYRPKNAISLKEAINDKNITLEQLKEIIVLSDADLPNDRWETFRNSTRAINKLHANTEMLRLIYEEGFKNSCKNKASLLEIRLSFTEDDQENISAVNTIRDAYYNVKKEYPELVVRIIAITGKKYKLGNDNTVDIIRSAIKLSKTLKDEYDPNNVKDFIIGIDLVGHEDDRKPLEEYREFLSSEEVQGSTLKLFLHAGESLRTDNNSVIDAYLLNSTRVGHGFNLYRFPSLMKKYADKKIAIEVSPLSNYRLGFVHDLRLHPALIYLQNGIPIVISSDNGLFFTEEPLVNDYYAAILSWDLDLAMIKQLSLNNIIYSGLSDKEIKILKNNWENDWNKFISDVLRKIEQ